MRMDTRSEYVLFAVLLLLETLVLYLFTRLFLRGCMIENGYNGKKTPANRAEGKGTKLSGQIVVSRCL